MFVYYVNIIQFAFTLNPASKKLTKLPLVGELSMVESVLNRQANAVM